MFHSASPAFSGGDMTLVTRAGRGVDDLRLRSGDWIMLSTNKTVATGVTVPVHQWYRVVNVGEKPDATAPAPYSRDVTVVGPDWDYDPTVLTQATIVRGVVEVLEKTIRLETSSMWTN